MKNRRLTCALLGVVGGCYASDRPPSTNANVDVVARGLEVAWSIAVSPDGRLFVAERPGRVRVIVRDTLRDEPWANIAAFDGTPRNFEAGLMGLALHPDFPATPDVYVCYTARPGNSGIINRVARLREQNGRGVELTTLVDNIPAGNYHNGCRVKIGPDRKLYVTTGDAYLSSPAQDGASLAGKVLRFELDGSIPNDNPFPSSPVWTLGHRNAQGIAWEPRTGRAFVTEHGSDTTDEINILQRGANYGWPEVRGRSKDPRFTSAAFTFHVAPTGAVFVDDSSFIMTSLAGRLILFHVRGDSIAIARDSVIAGYGRLRDVALVGDGSVYVSTSNRDRRGDPRRGDDRILRVRLR